MSCPDSQNFINKVTRKLTESNFLITTSFNMTTIQIQASLAEIWLHERYFKIPHKLFGVKRELLGGLGFPFSCGKWNPQTPILISAYLLYLQAYCVHRCSHSSPHDSVYKSHVIARLLARFLALKNKLLKFNEKC